tara:strand:+ start:2038 stop:2427 length:390 start_codon:yes stop_codon:yes gene_type:complete
MTEYEDEEDRRDREEDERIWRERREYIQSRVTPEDFAFFLHELEQIEARVIGQGLGGDDDGESDQFIFAAMRNVFYSGYVAGLDATKLEKSRDALAIERLRSARWRFGQRSDRQEGSGDASGGGKRDFQ